MNKKTIFIILFLIVIIGFIAFWIYRESHFSGEILHLEVSGPATVNVGEEITYSIKYKNKGNFVLQKPELIFIMPDNSLTEDGKMRITQSLKDIYPGEEKFVNIKTRLLGKEDDFKVAKAILSYTPQNLTARYESDASSSIKLNVVPITLNFDLPTKVEKGKDIQCTINYSSDIDYPLENLSIRVDHVSGFDVKSSNPPSLDNSEWKLKTLNKAQGGKIVVTGNVSADVKQSLTFSASLGMWQNGSFLIIKQATADVQVIQPMLFISQKVNGSGSYTASPGEVLHYQIFFRNVGSTPFTDLLATVKLDNSVLDISTLQTNGNQAQGNTVTWDGNKILQLKYLGAQEQGQVDFSVKVKDSWTSANSNAIKDEVNVGGITQDFSIKVAPQQVK